MLDPMLQEQTSEKSSISIKVVSIPVITEHEYFVRILDFDKSVLAVMFTGFIVLLSSLVF